MKDTAERAEKFLGETSIVSREHVTDSTRKPLGFLLRAPLGVLRNSLQTSYRSHFPSLGWDCNPGLGECWESILAHALIHEGQSKVLARRR